MKTSVRSGLSVGLLVMFLFLLIPCPGNADELSLSVRRDPFFQGEKPGQWAVILRFSHPVFATNLSNSTKVTMDGAAESFELFAPGGEQKATGMMREFRLVPVRVPSKAGSVKITIEKGLSDASGRLLLQREFAYQFLSTQTIHVTVFGTYYKTKADKGLNLTLSNPVEEEELMGAIKLQPAVPNLTVSRLGDTRYRIKGDFDVDREYLLIVAPSVVNGGSSVLARKEFKFKGPGIKPEISVRTERSAVELKGRQLLPLKLADVTKVRLKLTRIPPYLAPSIAAAMARNDRSLKIGSPDQSRVLEDLAKSGKIAPVFLGEFSDASEAFFAPEAKDNVYGYSLPLSFRPQPERGGIWMSSLSDPDGKVKGESSKLVQITDLSVSYKISSKNLLLWVTSVHTGQPVSGVDLLLFQSNGVASSIGKTDQNGVVFVQDGKKFPSITVGAEATGVSSRPLSASQVTSAVAATASDACFIELNQYRLKPFGVTQVQDLRETPDARTGYLFTERGVYRPGETVHFKFVARAYKENRIVSPTGEKAKLEIVGPRQDVVYSKELTLSEFGTCYDSLLLETFFSVGAYTLKATITRPDDKKDEFTRTFMVQEYKRPRHFVSLSVKTGERVNKEYISLEEREEFLSVIVTGEYYTGGPVKHAKVRWKATLTPSVHKVEGLDAYLFGNEDDSTLFLESGETMLDAEGKLNLTIPLDQRLLTGIYGVNVSATVLDIDGEPATEVTTYNPKPRCLVGIPLHPRQVQTGYASSMKIIVVDQQGKKIQQGKIEARIMQKKYLYTQKRDEAGNLKDLWEEGWMKTLTSQQSILNGEAQFSTEFNDYGDYLVAFTYEDKASRYSSQTLFKVGWDDYDNWIRRQAEKETRTGNQVLVSMSKKEYRAGEPVRIEFHTPRAVKKCLITLEKAGVLEYKIIDVNGTEGNYQFNASEQMQPNVYVSLIASAGRAGYPIYPSQTDTDIPTVYFGYADVTVRSEVQKLKLDIEPDQKELKGRPAEKKTLTFKVMDQAGKGVPSELAVCVVDEAVMALTRFKTPDLSSLAFFNLPLSVFSGDLRLALVSQDLLRMFTRPLTGGDVGFGEVAASLKIRKDFRPVAYFNPALVTDTSGRATVEFQLPDTTTAYRVYAVVCDKAAGFTSGQRNMVVTKEFFVEPSAPRFLIPGDRLKFPVVLHNKTAEKGAATLTAESSKNLTVSLVQDSAKIEPWSTSVLKTAAEVTSGIEKGWFRFKGKFVIPAGTYEDAIEQSLPIHSRYLPVNRVIIGSFSGKTDLSVDLPDVLKKLNPADINPADFKGYLSLSATNWARIAPGLKYLLHYPYGCVEQTSSGIIPLVGIRELVNTGTIPGIKIEQVDQFLNRGVERLLSMQLQGGGFSYWPGGAETSWWGSMYATFALIEAHQAGFKVPEARLKGALKFIRDGVFKGEETSGPEERSWTRQYAILNLAMGEMMSPAELEPFFRDYNSLSNQAKALLLLAAKWTQYLPQKKIADMVNALDPKLDMEKTSYDVSSAREIAICLMAAVESRTAAKKADSWAGMLLRGLQPDGKWTSTADTGWCLLALSKYYRGKDVGKPKTVKLKIDLGGEKPVEVTVSDAAAFVEVDPRRFLDKGKIHITEASKELVNYNLSVTYPDLATDPSALNKGFILNKKIENLNGKDEIRVGDVLRVTLEIGILSRSKQRSYDTFEYLALEDPVPAGLVPVNSELATEGAGESRRSAGPSWREGFADFTPTYMEFRDDGVRVFKNRTWSGQYRYSYLARAVTEGDFWMRGSRISLMYNPERFGKTEGRRMTVLPTK